MRLLTQSGTTNLKLDTNSLSGELLNTGDIIQPFTSSFTNWQVGVIFALVDIRLEVKLQNTLAIGDIPAINIEDSTAIKLEKSVTSKNNSELIGLKFALNNKDLSIVELKNYGIIYNISVLGRFGKRAKMLGDNSLLSCELVNLGKGVELAVSDYINISIDYLFEVSGTQPQDELLMRF